eukprot:TRINITY_DN138_c0_g1_i3.p1 TRINITY_DN138_c0_g1~~TRINITY_DN138_c0_g1_i3.p1  ORF type:complete len:380 (-),score=157.25 TRINITY_DN138_c0_g1_i3:36-1175(-)
MFWARYLYKMRQLIACEHEQRRSIHLREENGNREEEAEGWGWEDDDMRSENGEIKKEDKDVIEDAGDEHVGAVDGIGNDDEYRREDASQSQPSSRTGKDVDVEKDLETIESQQVIPEKTSAVASPRPRFGDDALKDNDDHGAIKVEDSGEIEETNESGLIETGTETDGKEEKQNIQTRIILSLRKEVEMLSKQMHQEREEHKAAIESYKRQLNEAQEESEDLKAQVSSYRRRYVELEEDRDIETHDWKDDVETVARAFALSLESSGMPQIKEWEQFVTNTLHPFLQKHCNFFVADVESVTSNSRSSASYHAGHQEVYPEVSDGDSHDTPAAPRDDAPGDVGDGDGVELKPTSAFALDGLSDAEGDIEEEGWGWDDEGDD